MNNCTLSQACAIACLTGSNSTPLTLNTSGPQASDACVSGAAPLTLSTQPVTTSDMLTISASSIWSNSSPAQQLTINP